MAGLGGPAPYWTDWTIDSIGNRTKEVNHAASGDTTTYQIPASGPTSVRPHSVTGATVTAGVAAPVTRNVTYDTAGNTLTRQGVTAAQTLTWNAEGKLTSTVEGSKTDTNVYDADGGRLIRRDATGTTLYLPGMEVRRAASGTITATRYYSFGGRTVATRNGASITGLSWIFSDHQAPRTSASTPTATPSPSAGRPPTARPAAPPPPGPTRRASSAATTTPTASSTSAPASTTQTWAASSPSTPSWT